MSQHFLLTSAASSLSLKDVYRLTENEAREMFCRLRWTGGVPACPHCGCSTCYAFSCRPIFKCKACGRQFSITSGTIFAFHKLLIRDYLAAIAIFVNGAKGVSALQLSRDLGVQYKTAFVLAHKLREAVAKEAKGETQMGTVEVDGAYFGGHVRLKNLKAEREDRRLFENRSPARKCVVAMRQRKGKVVPFVFKGEQESFECGA